MLPRCADCGQPAADLLTVTTGATLAPRYHRTRQIGKCCYREDGEADGALRALAPRGQVRPAGEQGSLGLGGGR